MSQSRGRPRIRKDAPLVVTMGPRFAEDEAEIIRQAAADAGMSASAWIRQAAIGTASLPEPERNRLLATAGAVTT